MGVAAVVAEYDPQWPEVFRWLRDRADAALAGVPHVTEHVGSTAVPGLDAKPIVDLDVVVPDAAGVGPAVAALAAAGWEHQGGLGPRLSLVTEGERTPPGRSAGRTLG